MPEPLQQRLHELLQVLQPQHLEIEDQSAAHAGHAGAKAGAHFRVFLVSPRFAGLPRVARHRLVYEAVAEVLPSRIHALALTLLAPGEPGSTGH